MSDFEIISVVIMVASLVLKAIKFGRDGNNKKGSIIKVGVSAKKIDKVNPIR